MQNHINLQQQFTMLQQNTKIYCLKDQIIYQQIFISKLEYWQIDFLNIIQGYMDKKTSKLKSHPASKKYSNSIKRKITKNSSTRTPKHLQSLIGRDSVHLSKFKTIHIKQQRYAGRSPYPTNTQFNQVEPQNNHKMYKTNQTEIDFPHSQSQKTITIYKHREKAKQSNKSLKTSKKNHLKKGIKFETQHFEQKSPYLTTRKRSVKKANLKNLLLRTEKVLQSYQRREQQWLREKEALVEQVQQMKKKDPSKKLFTHSASAYINTKHLY